MFDGFKNTDFMNALIRWDQLNKSVKCVYKQKLYDFPNTLEWKAQFEVDGGMILDGEWFTQV
jgi:hypothetical protein